MSWLLRNRPQQRRTRYKNGSIFCGRATGSATLAKHESDAGNGGMRDMDTQQSLMAVAAFVGGAIVAWAAAHWWFARKLKGAARGLERVEKARQFAAQQAAQARKQIE